ncbi:hypothetical protein FS749_000973 [Ceratobasidium sp. UAMH 11750]|nr:hypothetical protein FS749_000973 [Ceratobasidium sp. UAMH 11750]
MPELQLAIQRHLSNAGDFPNYILQLESTAQQMFGKGIELIQQVISDIQSGYHQNYRIHSAISHTNSPEIASSSHPTTVSAVQELNLDAGPAPDELVPSFSRSSSSETSSGTLSPTLSQSLLPKTPAPAPAPAPLASIPVLPASNATAPSNEESLNSEGLEMPQPAATESHADRGGYNHVPNTLAARKNNLTSPIESFLTKLTADPANDLLDKAKRLTLAVKFKTPQPENNTTPSASPNITSQSTPSPTEFNPGNAAAAAFGLSCARRCSEASEHVDEALYEYLAAQASLALWSAQMRKSQGGKWPVRKAHELLKAKGLKSNISAFTHWCDNGYRILRLVEASAIHQASKGTIHQVENVLRHPYSSTDISEPLRQLLVWHIQNFHLPMRNAFPEGIELGGRVFGVDWGREDAFWKDLFQVKQNVADDFSPLPRAWYWQSTHAQRPFPPPPIVSEEHFQLKTIATNFDPALPQNSKLPDDFKTAERTVAWTAKERERASQAECPSTIEDFERKYQAMHEHGHKGDAGYLYLSSELSKTNDILLHGAGDAQSNMIALVLASDTLPEGQADRLHTHLQLIDKTICYESIDTKALTTSRPWPALHLGVWNRYGWTARNHPGDDHIRERTVNHTQSQPYEDHSILGMSGGADPEHSEFCAYDMLTDSIRTTLQPVLEKLEHYIPNLLAEHEKLSVSLSPAFKIGCEPFCMCVVNIQPVTNSHRDDSDDVDSFCLVMALGEFTGGELCVYQPGLVMQFLPGTFVAIRSKRDVHFNLHYVGRRMSMVFTSDGDLKRWEKDRNGWMKAKHAM